MKVRITGPIKSEDNIRSYHEVDIDLDKKMMFSLIFIPQSKRDEKTLKEAENSVDLIKIGPASFDPIIPFTPTEYGKKELSMSITIGNNEK